MTGKLLDMRECQSPEFSRIWSEIRKIEPLLQPIWFRPFFRIPRIRRILGYEQWSREWEYPWAILSGDLRPGMRVIDVGCGGSPFPVYLGMIGLDCWAADPGLDQGKPTRGWRLSLLGFSGINMMWACPGRSRANQLPVRYFHDRIQELSFPEDHFDRVFCLSVMEHIPKWDWPVCMKQLAKVVKPGGKLILTLDMSAPDADARVYEDLIALCALDLVGVGDYPVPIPAEDKKLRHPGHTYETVGLVWTKAVY